MTASPEAQVLAFDEFFIDARQRLLIGRKGEPIPLPARAFDLLLFMAEHPGELLDKQRLLKAVWPHIVVEENNLSQNVSLLRRVLGEAPSEHRFIVTIPGRGFSFVPAVRRLDAIPRALAIGQGANRPMNDDVAPESGVGTTIAPTAPIAPPVRRMPTAAIAILATLAAAAIWFLSYLGRPAPIFAGATPIGPVSRVRPLTSFPGDETAPSFAPDGTRIAFTWARNGGDSDIYVMQIESGEPLRLTQGGGINRDPAWSPDGMQIAFLRQHDSVHLDLMVVPALGGAERKLQAVEMRVFPQEEYPRLLWTPDSRQLIYTTRREGLRAHEMRVLSLDTGQVRPLKLDQQDPGYDTSPALTRDASRLAFVRFRNGQRLGTLMVQDLAPGLVPRGPPQPVRGVTPGSPRSTFWSHDGQFLRFQSGADILEWNSKTGIRTVHTLSTTPDKVGAMALLSTDSGTRAAIVQIHPNMDIWAVPLDATRHVAAGPPAARAVSTSYEQHPRLSPDGRHLAFISGRSGIAALWVADADGTNPRQLSHIDEVVVGYPRWSPDGTRIAFHASARDDEIQIYVVEIDKGIPWKLAAGCCPSGWSADGRYLYAVDLVNGSVVRISVPEGKRESLFKGDSGSESVDGKNLFYGKPDGPGLFSRSMQGDVTRNPEQRLVSDYHVVPGGYMPVKGGIYYVGYTEERRPRAFMYYDFASRTTHDVLPAAVRLGWGLTVSADERELLYSADKDDAEADIALFDFSR